MNGLFLNLLRTSLVVGTAAALLTAVSPLWNRRYSPLWKGRLWRLLAVLLLVGAFLPSFGAARQITVPSLPAQAVSAAGSSPVQAAEAPASAGAQTGASSAAAIRTERARQPLSPLAAGELLWLAGAAGFALWTAAGELLLRRRLRRWARPPVGESMPALFRQVCGEVGVTPPELLICPGIGSPLLTGLLHPRLVLPSEDLPSREARYVLRHELIHCRNRDLWAKLLLLAANAVHWFNPAVWLLRRDAGWDLERACDDQVLAGADDAERRFYGTVLLSAAGKGRQSALSTSFGGRTGSMRRRLQGILSGAKRRGAALAAVCGVLTAAVVPLVACTQKTAAERGAESLKSYFAAHFDTASCACIYADLTHDGLDELVTVELRQKDGALAADDAAAGADSFADGTVTVLRASGRSVSAIWSGTVSSPHAGWGQWYLYRQDGQDFLLWYFPDQSTGAEDDRYRLFSLNESGAEQIAAQGEIRCATGDDAGSHASPDDSSQTEITAFRHAVSTCLQRAKPLLCFGEGDDGGRTLSCLTGQYGRFDEISGDPADAPETVQAAAEEFVRADKTRTEQTHEWDNAQSRELSSFTQVTDTEITALRKLGQTDAPDGSGTAEVWGLAFQKQLAHPERMQLAGDPELDDAGWLITPMGSYSQPLLNLWRDAGGRYTLMSTDIRGTIDDLGGSTDYYAAELVRARTGLRPDAVRFQVTAESGTQPETYRLEQDGGASCYVPEDWQSVQPETPEMLAGYDHLRLWRPAGEELAAVCLLHTKDVFSDDEAAARQGLRDVWSSLPQGSSLTISDYSGNLYTSAGTRSLVSAVSQRGGVRESLWYAFSCGDGSEGRWIMVVRSPQRGSLPNPLESRVENSLLSFCV